MGYLTKLPSAALLCAGYAKVGLEKLGNQSEARRKALFLDGFGHFVCRLMQGWAVRVS